MKRPLETSLFPVLLAAFLLPAVPAHAQAPYDEEPTASMNIRTELWKQFKTYAESLKTVIDYSSEAAYAKSIEPLRRQYHARLGYPPPGFTVKGAARMDRIGEDADAAWYRCYIPVAKGLDAYGLYIVPKKAKLPAPLVISMHGGGGYPELAAFKGGANYHDMVRGAAAQGYVVYAPHVIQYPYGDRDKGTPIPEDARQRLDEEFAARGTTLVGVETARIARALDVLLKRPEVDPRRVAMVGLSMGGTQTVVSASADPRIKVAVSSGSTTMETVNLICPRPFQVQLGNNDKLIGAAGNRAKAASQQVRRLYERLKIPERFEFRIFDGEHEFNGALAWEFLRKHL